MKKLIALLLALVMVLSLAACTVEKAPAETQAPVAENNDTPSNTNAPEAPVANNVEISLWTYPIGGWGNQDTVNSLIAAFEAATPGIEVTGEYLD